MKKSDSLAVANAERIATQLRQERNDALAMAQVKRELLDRAVSILLQVQQHLPEDAVLENGASARAEIDALITRATQ